jgi:hypothetical protein
MTFTRVLLAVSLISFIFVTPVALTGAPAGEGRSLKVEPKHSAEDCEDVKEGWGCRKQDHYSVILDGKEFSDWKALDAALQEASGGRKDPPGKDSGIEVLFSPEAKVPYQIVWGLLSACREAGLHRFVWDAHEAKDEGAGNDAARGSRRDVWIGLKGLIFEDGMGKQIDDGPWISDDVRFLEALRAAGAGRGTTAVLNPEADEEWGEVAKLIGLCRRGGLGPIEFLGFPAIPPGYSDEVSEDEANSLARSLDRATADEQPGLLDRLIDRHEMFRRMVGTIPLSVTLREMLSSMFVACIPCGKTLGDASVGTKPLRFLRTISVEGRHRPRFRILTNTQLNYVEPVLAKDPDGEIRIVDLFNLSLGDLQTHDGRMIFIPNPFVLPHLNKLLAPTPEEMFDIGNRAMKELFDFLVKGKDQELLDYFRKNLDQFKGKMKAHRIHLAAAGKVGANSFAAAVRDMEMSFPGNPALLLLKLESSITKGDLKGTLDAADELDLKVRGDPYLDVVRARAHLTTGDPANARACAEKAAKAEPDLGVAWWVIVEACLGQKDFQAVTDTLSKIEEKGMKIGDLEGAPAYAEFVKSEEYRRWREPRK